jgi:hypothetical protein
MKKYVKEFFFRGMMFGGLGPIVLAIIYYIVSVVDTSTIFEGKEILSGIISVYLLAFVHAGASVFNQIEEWGINKSIAAHFATLYAAYSVCYFTNTWIPFEAKTFAVFTGVFVAIYAVVWTIVYLCVRKSGKKISDRLKNV